MREKMNDIAQMLVGAEFELGRMNSENKYECLCKAESYVKEAVQKVKRMETTITTEVLLHETDQIIPEAERMAAIDEIEKKWDKQFRELGVKPVEEDYNWAKEHGDRNDGECKSQAERISDRCPY
jgi:ribosome recycling factor